MNKNYKGHSRNSRFAIALSFALALFSFNPFPVHAATGRLLATGGATTIEGNAGGGIVPLALIAGLGTKDEIGGTVFGSYIQTDDYHAAAGGVAMGFYNRVELSISRLGLHLGDSELSSLPGNSLTVDTVGVKIRLYGDAVYDADSVLPQFSLGARYQKNRDKRILEMVGSDDEGFDGYLAASKLLFGAFAGKNVLLNGVVRLSEANQLGLLGFGGENESYEPQLEGSLAVFLNRETILGAEYRMKPDSISVLGIEEDDWWDVYLGIFPTKHLGIVAGYVDLGTIGLDDQQRGFYLSLQGTF